MFYLHGRGVKGYLTLNTLVFAEELAVAERIARQAISSGVDAFIVQDLPLLRPLHALCPEFPLHASTQKLPMKPSIPACLAHLTCCCMTSLSSLELAQIAAV